MRQRAGLFVGVLVLAIGAPAAFGAAHPDRATKHVAGDLVPDTPVEVQAAHDEQHGGPGEHLPGSSENVELVGQADIAGAAPDRVADVSAFGRFAFLTVRDPVGCSDAGVAIFDIGNPRAPTQIGFVPATEGSFPGEGSQVVNLQTRFFRGPVLVFNNELCALGGEGGFSLWNVSNPRRPTVLTQNAGDPDASEMSGGLWNFNHIHSAFAWQDGNRAFVVTVDNMETTDVDIYEITDPRNPVFVAELDLNDFGVAQDEVLTHGNFQGSFLHDMVVKRVRGEMLMLLSYWDGGWVVLDVDDPANPRFVGDSDYPSPDTLFPAVEVSEGNAHQAEFSPDGEFIIGTDEDFSPFRLEDDVFRITTGPSAGAYPGGEFGWTVPIATYPGEQINGPTIYGGLGCPSNEEYGQQPRIPPASALAARAGEEKIVVLLRGLCFFSEKVEQAQLVGYDAVFIANNHVGASGGLFRDATLCGSQGHDFTPAIAAVCIGHRAFHLLFRQTPRYFGQDTPVRGRVGARVAAGSQFDGWGYVRLLDGETLAEIDAYAIDEALDPAFAFGFGSLSVHEVAIDPRNNGFAYLSYYSGGFRVIRYGEAGIEEVGHYIDEGGNDFWGVEVHRLPRGVGEFSRQFVVLASDRDSGLWIFRYTGA